MIGDCFQSQTAHNRDMNEVHDISGRKIGYIRVSDKDQTEALQFDALKAEGCDPIFIDHGVSGAKVSRPALDDMMEVLQSGDTLTVWKLDRLGRSAAAARGKRTRASNVAISRAVGKLLNCGVNFR